jgi:uncharacterized Zn-binding protein involved in type VI secretion
MGVPVCRIGDVGVGDDHCHDDTKKNVSGILINGAGTVTAEGSPVGRIGDIVMRGDGHSGVIVSGAGTVTAEGPNVSVIGSVFVGCFTGIMVTGAGSVTAG